MRERKCELLGKRANRDARLVSFSHIRSKKHQGVNLHEKRVWWAEVRSSSVVAVDGGGGDGVDR